MHMNCGKRIYRAALLAAVSLLAVAPAGAQQPAKPNIVIIWGDDIGQSNVSAYSRGLMGYQTPNIDRIASEGMMFTDSMPSRAAPPAGPRSSPARPACAPA